MIDVDIPGFGHLQLAHLVLDYNGTLAVDGQIVAGAGEMLQALSRQLAVHVITADTFGKVRTGMAGIDCRVSILPADRQAEAKRDYIAQLGPERTAAIGNGRNDALMLETSALGMAVILEEGAAARTLNAADVVCHTIVDALALLSHPLRLTATLRS